MTNDEVKQVLLEHARELDRKGGSIFQARAFRAAALLVQGLPRPLEELVEQRGRRGLESIPGIGKSIAYAIDAILTTGRLRTLRDPSLPPREEVRQVAGVGHRLAERLHDELGIRTVSELREADLDSLPPHQQEAIAADLAEAETAEEPATRDLLAVDALFRERGEAGPFRRGGWLMRARYSLSALAFRQGKTRDWVEVSFTREAVSGSRMIVTEGGARVVRGREGRRVA
jgi:DNA polymerase (family 10)